MNFLLFLESSKQKIIAIKNLFTVISIDLPTDLLRINKK